MAHLDWLTTHEIKNLFEGEVRTLGGTVSESFDDGLRLFARAVLPAEREVQRGDRLQGGVAIRATDEEISVYPYVFRQVCRNGAIFAQSLQGRHLARVELPERDDAAELEEAVRETIHACCAPEAFAATVDQMKWTVGSEIDLALNMMPMLARLPAEHASRLLQTISDRYTSGRDPSRFGLMNAVTSVARDTSDPDLRWRLEELGGGLACAISSPRPPRPVSAVAERNLLAV